MLSFKPGFSLSSFTFIKRLFSSSSLSAIKVVVVVVVWSLSRVLPLRPRLATLVACQAPLSMGFSRQEGWSGLPFPSPAIYLRLLIFFLAILIPACDSSSLAFHVMYSAYKLHEQGDNRQPWRPPFPIWNQSVVPYPVPTVASWLTYRFLRK